MARANVHAHYEFRVDRKPRNPQTFNPPGASPLQGRQLTLFKAQHADATARLDDITNDAKTRLVSAAGSHR